MPPYENVAIVGVGLLGGSIGLALRARALAATVTGVGRRHSSLDQALACGAIERATTQLAEGVADAELVVVCTPVARVAEDVCRALAAAPPQALVTDVGSTKARICAEVAATASTPGRFVGSHPLAGDHRQGPEHARADLLTGKTVVITPTATTAPETTITIQKFWQSLGAELVEMAPPEHDQALASASHLPHLVAAALAAATPADALRLAATGWADTTRIAAGNPNLWTQIFAHNTPALLAALDRLLDQLHSFRQNLQTANWKETEQQLIAAKRIRDVLGN